MVININEMSNNWVMCTCWDVEASIGDVIFIMNTAWCDRQG